MNDDLRNFIVATPTQLKRASNSADVGSFGLITNGRPIQRMTSTIAQPRSRRSSIASTDSPRLVTTPGRRNSMTPRSRRNSLAVADRKIEKRRLSLSLVLEKPYGAKENQAIYALISPQLQISKHISDKSKTNITTHAQIHDENKSDDSGTGMTSVALNHETKDKTQLIGNNELRLISPMSSGHNSIG